METRWHYSREGKQYGPVPESDLKLLIETGEVSPLDYVWKEGLPEWVKATSHKDVLSAESRPLNPPQLPTETGDGESVDSEEIMKAKHNHLQATFKLNECQAHLKVYGERLDTTAQEGLEFIEEALRIDPESSAYLNTKGLLLSDGLAKHCQALDCLTRALEFEPDSIVIGQNLRNIEQLEQTKHQSKGCFGLFLVLAASGFGVCAALSILCMS